MYVVLGAGGHTGHVVASNLLSRGQKVRVVGRNAAHLQPLTAKGAELFIADVTDTEALATLPRREMLAGYAELVKYGLIADADFFD